MTIAMLNSRVYSALSAGLLTVALAACGGKQEPPAAAPPAVASTPVAPVATPAPAPTPAPVAVEAPPPAPAKHQARRFHVPMAGMLFAELSEVGLSAEQKAKIDSIQADLEKQADAQEEPNKKLVADIADSATAGKLDRTKVDADTKAIVSSAVATGAPAEDALNKLYKALEPAQRKKLVELVGAKMAKHAEHGKGAKGEHAEHGKGAKGEHAEHDKGAKGEHAEHGMGPMGEGCPFDHAGGDHSGPEKLPALLGLTPQQDEKLKAKLAADKNTDQAAMKEHMATMQKHMKAFGDAFVTDKFEAKTLQLGKHAGDMAKKMVVKKVRFVEAVLSVITPEQRAKFSEHIRAYAETNAK